MLLISILSTPITILIIGDHRSVQQAVIPLIDTTENIHLGLASDRHIQSLKNEMAAVDYVWGAVNLHIPRVHKSFYFKFDRAGGYPGEIGFPAYYDKSWFLKNHPDWLVYLCDKTTLAYEFHDPNVPLDITNPHVLQFMLDTWIYPALNMGYDGIGFDNVNLDNMSNRCGIWKSDSHGRSIWTYLYGSPSSIGGQLYVASVVNWAKFMYHAIHTYKPGATMEMNFSPRNGGVLSKGLAFNEQLLPYIDVDIDESGLTNRAGNPAMTTDLSWELEAEFAEKLAALGKGQFFITGYPEPNLQSISKAERQWTLSNYLMFKGIHTYLFISSAPDDYGSSYGYINIIPEYSVKIGHALNTMYQLQGVYMRDYSHGKAIVNPSSSHTSVISLLPNRYKDLYGNVIQGSITLQPHSGMVLLFNT